MDESLTNDHNTGCVARGTTKGVLMLTVGSALAVCLIVKSQSQVLTCTGCAGDVHDDPSAQASPAEVWPGLAMRALWRGCWQQPLHCPEDLWQLLRQMLRQKGEV